MACPTVTMNSLNDMCKAMNSEILPVCSTGCSGRTWLPAHYYLMGQLWVLWIAIPAGTRVPVLNHLLAFFSSGLNLRHEHQTDFR